MMCLRIPGAAALLCASAAMLPFQAHSAALGQALVGKPPTYTLSGSIGLWAEDYVYEDDATNYSRERLSEELMLRGSGPVWDRRFLFADIGVTLRREDTYSDDSDSDTSLVGYSVNTTWLAGHRNPLNLFATSSRTTVDGYDAPAYDIDTRTLGANWGLKSELLGNMYMRIGHTENESDSETQEQDETTERAEIEGKKRIGTSEGISSDLHYGFKHYDTDDKAENTTGRRQEVYVSDSTTLSSDSLFSAYANYYESQDDSDATVGRRTLDTRFFSTSANLSTRASARLRHYYGVDVSASDANGTGSDVYGGHAGVDYAYTQHWRQHAMVRGSYSRIERTEETGAQKQYGGQTGLSYSNRFGDFMFHGNYSISLDRQDYAFDSSGAETGIGHAFSSGYSRSVNHLWQDNLVVGAAVNNGLRDTVETTARYAITSVPSPRDVLNASVDIRDYSEEDESGERQSFSQRIGAAWNRRLWLASSVAVSAGYSRTQSDSKDLGMTDQTSSTFQFSHVQARFTTGVGLGFGRGSLGMTLRREAEDSPTRDAYRTTLDGDAGYARGLWQFQLRYRWRDEDASSENRREQAVLLNAVRRFGTRF